MKQQFAGLSQGNQSAKNIQSQLNESEPVNSLETAAKSAYLASPRILKGDSIFSRLFFTWIKCVLQYGKHCKIDINDLPLLHQSMDPKSQFQCLDGNIQKASAKSPKEGTLLVSILGSYRRQITIMLVMALFTTIITMSLPVLTHKILEYIQRQPENRQFSKGLYLFIAIVIVTLTKTILQSQLYYRFGVFGFALSNNLTLLIYKKSLKYPSLRSQKYPPSKIVNLSQVDAQRMTSIGPQLTSVIFIPLQIIIGFWLMYSYIGLSFMVGIAVMILMIATTIFIGKRMSRLSQSTSLAKDERMKVTQQLLNGIKFIKTNAEEKWFFNKLDDKRKKQLMMNRKRGIFQISLVCLYNFSFPLIIFLTFYAFSQFGNNVEAALIFSSIMIFNIIQSPLRQLPTTFSNIIQIKNSLQRIQQFLLSEQILQQNVKESEESEGSEESGMAVIVKNGSFSWYQQSSLEIQWNNLNISTDLANQQVIDKSQYFLNNINLSLKKRQFYVILGETASGKSSLFSAILGQMKKSTQSQVIIDGTLSYCSQKPYIINDSVKENILFKKPYNKQRFQQAIHYSCLEKDPNLFANGELTQIGQKGSTISGGQRARIALARALYSDRDIFLLDDILSAVDTQTASFLVENTIKKYLSKKTVILITHSAQFCKYADQIIVAKNGKIAMQGPFDKIDQSSWQKQVGNKVLRQSDNRSDEKKINQDQIKLKETLEMIRNNESLSLSRQKNESYGFKAVKQLIIPEEHLRGSISLQLVKEFVIHNGSWYVGMVCMSMVGWLIFSIYASMQLQSWCEDAQHSNNYLYMYLALSIWASGLLFLRGYTLISSSSRQGLKVHREIIKSILYASYNEFHNRVPMGRIINRLSKDMRQLDETVISAITSFLTNLFSFLATLSICTYASSPIIILPALIVILLCEKLRTYYMTTQRQIIRIEAKTNSPIVTGFLSAIHGLPTIRAFQMQKHFFEDQIERVSVNKRARITREALESWFAFRLSIFSFVITILSIALGFTNALLYPAHMGILLAYAFNLNDEIISLTFSWTNLQTKMISIERVFTFMKIQPERGYAQYSLNWINQEEGYKPIVSKGQIQFKNVSLRYRRDLPFALKDVSFRIKEGEKVGIVGRTGAGKSTIFNVLTRLVDPVEGHIFIDGIDHLKLQMKDLRSSLTIIDQQPVIFSGTFRQNLCLSHPFSDNLIFHMLRQCQLYDKVMENGGLDGKVDNNTFSVGEKQIICICRACLKNSKIILIDQASANIDERNDDLIQSLIKRRFQNSTILTIAHRLSTLQNVDKIIVLGQGEIVEYGTIEQLRMKQNGIFHQLAQPTEKQLQV